MTSEKGAPGMGGPGGSGDGVPSEASCRQARHDSPSASQLLRILPIEEWMPLWTLAAVGVATALVIATAAALILALLDRSAAEARRRRFRRPRATKEAGLLGSVADVRPVPLSTASRDDYLKRWRYLLSRFVEQPRVTTAETHDLTRKLLAERGYSLEDLDRDEVRFPDEHLVVAENYRMAQRATSGLRSARTEQLRRAMLHMRVVLEELLADPPYDLVIPPRKQRRRERRRAENRPTLRPAPDVDRYRVLVTDEGAQPPREDQIGWGGPTLTAPPTPYGTLDPISCPGTPLEPCAPAVGPARTRGPAALDAGSA